MLDHPDRAPGLPQIDHVTRTLRAAAAAAAGDADRLNLWAGQGCRHAAELPAGDVVSSWHRVRRRAAERTPAYERRRGR